MINCLIVIEFRFFNRGDRKPLGCFLVLEDPRIDRSKLYN